MSTRTQRGSVTDVTRTPVPNPGVSVDIRDIANKQVGKPTRPKRGRQTVYRARSRIVGQPSPEEIAVYADYISGGTILSLMAKYGYASTNSITAIVKKIDKWLIPQFMGDIRAIKCQHTERLLHIVSEAMAAWERSKRDKVQFEHERDDTGRLTLLKMKREAQAGNPTFLATAMKALEDVRKIWGADAPVRMEVSGEIRVAGRTILEARTELAEQMVQARDRLLATSAN